MFYISQAFLLNTIRLLRRIDPVTIASSTGKEGSCKEGCEQETQGERQTLLLLFPDSKRLLLLRTSGARLLPCSVPEATASLGVQSPSWLLVSQ